MDKHASEGGGGEEEREDRWERVGGGMVHLMQNSRGCPPHYMSRKKSALYWCKKFPDCVWKNKQQQHSNREITLELSINAVMHLPISLFPCEPKLKPHPELPLLRPPPTLTPPLGQPTFTPQPWLPLLCPPPTLTPPLGQSTLTPQPWLPLLCPPPTLTPPLGQSTLTPHLFGRAGSFRCGAAKVINIIWNQ